MFLRRWQCLTCANGKVERARESSLWPMWSHVVRAQDRINKMPPLACLNYLPELGRAQNCQPQNGLKILFKNLTSAVVSTPCFHHGHSRLIIPLATPWHHFSIHRLLTWSSLVKPPKKTIVLNTSMSTIEVVGKCQLSVQYESLWFFAAGYDSLIAYWLWLAVGYTPKNFTTHVKKIQGISRPPWQLYQHLIKKINIHNGYWNYITT